MSKPDPTGAKSLEEILASIRRSLVEEPAVRPPEPQVAPAKAGQPRAEAGIAGCRRSRQSQRCRIAGQQARRGLERRIQSARAR